MNKKSVLILLVGCILLQQVIIAQTGTRPKDLSTPVTPALSNKYALDVKTTDFNGRPYQALYPDAEGTPYFSEDLSYANLLLNKGATYQHVRVRLDLVNHELHIINGAGNEIVSENGLVRKVEMTDSVTGLVHYRFITGCPPVDQQDANQFYQVLSDGRLQLLLYTKKEFVEEKNSMSGEIRHLFKERSEVYTLRDGMIVKLKRDKDYVLSLMTDKQAEVEAWLKTKKMNYKSNGMLAGLFDYYNSLVKPF
jgi:hypothetical protein